MFPILIVLAVFLFLYRIILYFLEFSTDWPQLNEKDIVQSLSPIVFGQEVAIGIIALALQTHVRKLKGGFYKPLILSFHGSSGVGKTFLSSQIEQLFPGCSNVHTFYPSIHFKGGARDHLNNIVNHVQIQNFFRPCEWNIIVVDDAQDITEEAQKAFREVFSNMKGSWFYRKVIVMFVSNLYRSEINSVVFDKVKYKGTKTFYQSDFDPIFKRGQPNWLTKMYREGSLDAFVPFMPLHKNTVLKCIKQDMKRYTNFLYKDIVNGISNDIQYYTFEGNSYQYSISGCKKVADKTALWMKSVI